MKTDLYRGENCVQWLEMFGRNKRTEGAESNFITAWITICELWLVFNNSILGNWAWASYGKHCSLGPMSFVIISSHESNEYANLHSPRALNVLQVKRVLSTISCTLLGLCGVGKKSIFQRNCERKEGIALFNQKH